MSDIKFQASESSGSEEEDFFNIFYVFLWLKSKTLPLLLGRAISGPGRHLKKFGKVLLADAKYQFSRS